MKRILAVFLSSLIIFPTFAADNTVILTPGTGVTMRTRDIGSGVQSSQVILGDISGNSILGTAGTSNANVITIQGIASGTAVPVTVSNVNPNGQAISANSSPVVGATGTIAGGSTGTAGSSATTVVSIQGIASGTAVPVSFSSGTVTISPSNIGATASSVPANAGLVGGRAATAEPTAVTDGQLVAKQLTVTGRTVTAPYSIKELMVRGTADSTDGAAHTIIASAGGSLKNYITDWECSNTSATNVTVTFNDSVSTKIIVPATSGNNKSLHIPIVTAAATAFQFTVSTGVSTVTCNAQGYTGS